MTFYTDMGVNITIGSSMCRIIISSEIKEVKIKAKLPIVDLTGATTAEYV